MKRVLCAVSIFGILAVAVTAWAEDSVFVRGKDKDKAIKGFITKESASGVVLKDGTVFRPDTIEDVVYDVTPVKVLIAMYRPAYTAEKESLDPTKQATHKAKLDEAIKKYQETAASDIKEPNARRHAEFKVAVLSARQAAEQGKAPDAAIEALKKFKSKHPDSWQIGSALQLLGRLQLEQRDFAGAKETYSELSQANVPDDVKQEALLQVIQVSIRSGDTASAKTGLDGLLKNLPKESKHALRARVVQAELQIAGKEYDNAIKLLRGVAKDTTDKQLKAMAYNALGVCLFEKEDWKGARWEFLWVDVVYNQDKAEHAKALYYLWKTFEQLGDAEKGQDCVQLLLNDTSFAASEWRAKAQKEFKAP